MFLEAIKLSDHEYWVDFDRDGLASNEEVIVIKDRDQREINKALVSFASTGYSKQYSDVIQLYRQVRIFQSPADYLNEVVGNSPVKVDHLRHSIVQLFNENIVKLEKLIKKHRLDEDHPYVKLKADLQDQIKILKRIRIRVGSFSEMYPNKDVKGALALYEIEGNYIAINFDKFNDLSPGVLVHELDHAVTIFRSKRWRVSDKLLIGKAIECELPTFVGKREIKPTQENSTLVFEVDFPTDISRKKLTYNSVYSRFSSMPIRYTGAGEYIPNCLPDETYQNYINFELKGHQAQARFNAFNSQVDPNIFLDLKDPKKRSGAIKYLRAKFPVYGNPNDKAFMEKNYENLIMLHYFGIGVQEKPGKHDLHDLLMIQSAYSRPIDPKGCAAPKFPELK